MEGTKVLILMIGILAAANAVKTQPSLRITGRSARWDEMINHEMHRQKRQASGWQTGTCTLGDVTQFDAIGRRNSGLLAPVRNQGQCGSCWAFASTHAVSDARSIQAGRRLDLLSAQYTARCAADFTYGYGCCGGLPSEALKHFEVEGTVTDSCLSYNAANVSPRGTLTYKRQNPLQCFANCDDRSSFNLASSFKLHSYSCSSSFSETVVINALNSGRVAITVIGSNRQLGLYTCGVLSGTPLERANHAVVIVDYGTTDTGENFWVVKNSWGTSWGESGYFRVRRGGELGIGRYEICVPLLATDSALPSTTTFVGTATCAEEDVSDPEADITTMSAAEFALENLISRELVECPNGNSATGYTELSFRDADVQVVAGSMVDLDVIANIEGCGTPTSKSFRLTVLVDLNGNFSVTDYSIGNSAKAASAPLFLSLIMVAITFLLKD